MTDRPNLFDFATSELSQDAFICWLLSWANPTARSLDPILHEAGSNFLKSLFSKSDTAIPADIRDYKVKKQYQSIDVLVLINARVALVVEDKVHTANHSEQLVRYRNVVAKGFPDCGDDIACIYLKTGDQSKYEDVKRKGYNVFTRSDFLDVLRQGRADGVSADIYLEFLDHLEGMERAVFAYRDLPLNEWDWSCWTGFYIDLQKTLGDGSWDYVANPRGGFMGFWWHWKGTKYLQIEGEFDPSVPSRLCFKLEVEDADEQSEQRNRWYHTILAASSQAELALSKPKHFGKGTYMTAAIADEEFRKTDANGIIDMEGTVSFLRRAERFLDHVVGQNRGGGGQV